MSDKIASKNEVQMRMVMLKTTAKFLKENHITEKSKTGQLLVDLDQQLENTVIKTLDGLDKN